MDYHGHFGYNVNGLESIRVRVDTDPKRDPDTEDTDPELVFIKNGGYYMQDKRKFLRFNVSLDARSKASGWFAPKKSYSVKDVSREGLKLASKEAMKYGEMLKLEVSVPTERAPIKALGQVMWNQKTGDSSYDVGLKFKDVRSEGKYAILSYAYDNWVKERKLQESNR